MHKTGTGRWQTQVYFSGNLYHVGAHDNPTSCARTYAVCMALVARLKERGLLRETANYWASRVEWAGDIAHINHVIPP